MSGGWGEKKETRALRTHHHQLPNFPSLRSNWGLNLARQKSWSSCLRVPTRKFSRNPFEALCHGKIKDASYLFPRELKMSRNVYEEAQLPEGETVIAGPTGKVLIPRWEEAPWPDFPHARDLCPGTQHDLRHWKEWHGRMACKNGQKKYSWYPQASWLQSSLKAKNYWLFH